MSFRITNEKIGENDSERCIEIPWALSKYSDEQTVLDIGYANAEERYIGSLLLKKIPYLHGIDISEKFINGIVSHIGDIRHTPFKDNFFDLVLCISTIEHVGRDNSVYGNGISENAGNGDFEAIKEIYRITKNEGKVILTVPFGKFFNYGWFIQYDENRLNALLSSCSFDIVDLDFFKYENGWSKCNKAALKNILYKDNNAPAAAGLVCVLLEKKERIPSTIQEEITYNSHSPMNNNNYKTQAEKLSVEEILKRIQENVRQRQKAECEIEKESGLDTGNTDKRSELLRRDITHINSNWNIHNNDYIITSQKPCLGKLLIKGRQLVHGEVRRYVDPMISRQSGFNRSVARIINETIQKNAELEQQYAGLIHQYSVLELKLKNLEDSLYAGQKIQDQKISQRIELVDSAIEIKIDERIDDHLTQMDENIHERAWLAHILEDRIQKGLETGNSNSATQSPELNYYLFEERFRGARESIRQQQLAFLPYFENCACVLDIGCGRGEFLEILRDHNIGGIGIDIDPDMIQYCMSHHLTVEQIDAITFLEKTADNSLDGVFIDQVVEHLEPDYLVKMLGICYQKLRWGSNIVVETVNPLSLASFFNFYLDMSHHKPVHPLTLDFLLESVGFRGNVIKYYSTISDREKLQKIPIPEKTSETEQKFLSTYNSNIEQLNNLLWGPRDYAIIGRKLS